MLLQESLEHKLGPIAVTQIANKLWCFAIQKFNRDSVTVSQFRFVNRRGPTSECQPTSKHLDSLTSSTIKLHPDMTLVWMVYEVLLTR